MVPVSGAAPLPIAADSRRLRLSASGIVMNRSIVFLALAVFAAAAAPAGAAEYQIDARHTQVRFTYNHFGYSNISGQFGGVSGRFEFDPAAPTKARIEVSLPMDTLHTGVAKLDEDLLAPGFFDAAQFPEAHFKSGAVTAEGDGRLAVAGELTIHGVTRPVTLAVTINKIGEHPFSKRPAVGFDASTTIRRSDFGIARMVPMVSDEVRLDITLEAQVPAAP